MTETAGWGITAQLPPQIQRRMIDADHDDRQAERDEKAARERRHEEAADRVVALGIAAAHARGEYPEPMELAAMRLPADDKERDARTEAAIQHVLDTQRAQYQRELAWEKDHPRPPAGPPEKLHIEFVDDPELLVPASRSATGMKIFRRARAFRGLVEARRQLAAAERAAEASKNDYGFVPELRGREDGDPVVVVTASRRRGGTVPADSGLRFR